MLMHTAMAIEPVGFPGALLQVRDINVEHSSDMLTANRNSVGSANFIPSTLGQIALDAIKSILQDRSLCHVGILSVLEELSSK
jgi:hypothetical protein